ncbi:hypothetical protein J6590_024676 [Homalodisca vitripennis]|nr:hypothetical protein J6590_024676 [Homalodisca vitripennis]
MSPKTKYGLLNDVLSEEETTIGAAHVIVTGIVAGLQQSGRTLCRCYQFSYQHYHSRTTHPVTSYRPSRAYTPIHINLRTVRLTHFLLRLNFPFSYFSLSGLSHLLHALGRNVNRTPHSSGGVVQSISNQAGLKAVTYSLHWYQCKRSRVQNNKPHSFGKIKGRYHNFLHCQVKA